MSQSLRFREINVDQDAEICIEFRAESFVESFGSAERFYRAAGQGAKDYLDGLRSKNRDWPGSCVHAWLGDQIVGQVEVRRDRTDPSRAHVLLYYLRSDLRGRGLGEQIDAYVRGLFRSAGVHTATLRVSPTNVRAMAFYRKRGWHDEGPDSEHPGVHIMERVDLES
jgi:ribosomal protein S18 acetylase RimI-like enzyme